MTKKQIKVNLKEKSYDVFIEKKAKNGSFTFRSWARKMGCSHAQLIMLLRGKRPFRQRHIRFLKNGIKLSSQEMLYLQALIQFESSTSVEEKELGSIPSSPARPQDERPGIFKIIFLNTI